MRQLGQNHTVIFSSHLLSEIQQLCQRAVILHRGKLIREADMGELTDTSEALRLRASIRGRQQALLPALLSLPCVRRVKPLKQQLPGVTEVSIECERNATPDAQTAIFRLLCAMDAPLMQLVTERDTLEDAFLRATSAE